MSKKPFRKIFHFGLTEKTWLERLAVLSGISEAQVVRDLILFAGQRAGLPDPRQPPAHLLASLAEKGDAGSGRIPSPVVTSPAAGR